MKSVYDEMWQKASRLIQSKQSEPDPWLDVPNDTRRGLTLIIRPERQVLDNFSEFLKSAEEIEPRQYFYAPSEIHITVMSIISCTSGFELSQIAKKDYIKVVQSCLNEIEPFDLNFRGITASANCVMAQGYPTGSDLARLRTSLRKAFANTELDSSIDSRYPIRTAHSTLIRFREQLTQPESFLELLSHYREEEFGSTRVSDMFLVFNDWYQRASLVKNIKRFYL